MTNLVAFPDRRKAREEASSWLARMDRGLSVEERAEMGVWLNEATNHHALVEMGRLWHEMDVMSVLAELFPLSRSAPNCGPRRFSLPRLAIAASAVACCMLAGVALLIGSSHWQGFGSLISAPVAAHPAETYSTAVGESRSVTLADGSLLRLNTNTVVAVRLHPHAREVVLERGEANFEVAHDPARPFNVHAGGRILQAVGTAFNVRIVSAESVELTVTEGAVKVLRHRTAASSPGGSAALRPETTVAAHEIAIMEPGLETVRRLEPAEMDVRLAWQRGMLIFKGEPLGLVLSEVDRYTNTEFVLADRSLRNVRVGGYFRAGDIEGLLVALRANFRIDSRRDGDNRIILTRE